MADNQTIRGGMGGRRPGAGRPKGSKNRATKAEAVALSERAKAYADEALATLAEVMRNKEAPPAARVSASESILNRGYGKPTQSVEVGALGGGPLPVTVALVAVSPDAGDDGPA